MAELRKKMLIAIVAMIGMVSCTESSESTFVGFEYDPINTEQELVYEGVDYICDLDTVVNRLYAVEQYVRGEAVLYQGDNELRRNKFEHDLNLEANFAAEPELVYVRKKENLSDVAVTSVDTYEVDDLSADEGAFTRTTLEKNYEFFFNEGEIVSVKTICEKMAHGTHEFAYASIKNVLYNRSEAKLNEEISNADSTVYDVNLYFLVDVASSLKEEVNKKYEVRVPVQRIYKEAPADAVTTIEGINYVADFATRENELYTVRQFVTGDYVTRLRDEEIGRKTFKYDLNLNVLFSQPNDIYVDSEEKLTTVALKSSSSDNEVVEDDTIDEFTLTSHSKNYVFNFNEGEVIDVTAIYQKLSDDDTVFDYAKIKNVRYVQNRAVLNQAQTNEDQIVYDVELLFAIELEKSNVNDATKTYNVNVLYQRIYVPEKPDTYDAVMENVDYVGEFDTASKRLYTVEQSVNGEWVTYKNNEEEMSREAFSRKLNLEAIFDVPEVVYVGSELQLGQVSLSSSSKDGDKINKVESDGFTTTNRTMAYHFKFNENEKVLSSTEYEKESYGEDEFVYSSIENVRYNKYDARINEKKTNKDSTVYDITLYFDVEVKRQEQTVTRSSDESETYLVAVPYMRVCKHMIPSVSDEFIKKAVRDVKREIVSNGVEKVSFTEYELWSLSGEKNAKTISLDLYFGFTEPAEQTVYTENTDYFTTSNGDVAGSETSVKDGNWTVYTKTNSYSSTADNGHKSFTNKYSYNSQKAVYKNEYYEVEFDYGSWSISEGNSTVGSKSGETTYNGKTYEVYPYVNNVSYVYDVTTDSYTGNGKSNVNICTVKETPKVIPDSWGNIIGAGISAVPADDVRGDYAKKCLCIRTENGAVAITFGMDTDIPSVETILAGNFVNGNYSAEYNSGIYLNGNWTPAVAKDLSDRIAYYQDGVCKRNIRSATLQMWNWRNGNLSTVVDGYNFFVSNNGTLIIEYNGVTVMSLR